MFVGGHGQESFRRAARDAHVEAVAAPAVRAPRSRLDTPVVILKLAIATVRAWALLRRHRVDAVLGMGGYTSVAVGIAAWLSRTPLILHDGNAVAGRANRILSSMARVLALSYPLRNPEGIRCGVEMVGMPVRQELLAASRKADMRPAILTELGLDPEKLTLLVFGGSQGARVINDIVPETIRTLRSDAGRLQIIHLTGHDNNEGLERSYREAGFVVRLQRYEPHIEKLLIAADLCLCRAGGSTIAELALFGLPAILVPLAAAADGHQLANAQTSTEIGGAIVIEESQLSADGLAAALTAWLNNPEPFRARGVSLHANARPDAAKHLLTLIGQIVDKA
jgi:UDP-N-acetylglucosamine--N-acetylmuramyl-(pentapeptide) pyrophosphoryl-undecaprenol N-acetylglucosamine transferase